VIGNPPWERMKLQEREFFSFSAPKIATAVNAAQRRRLIEAMKTADPALYARYEEATTAAERALAHVRDSGRFPHTGRGDVNTTCCSRNCPASLLPGRPHRFTRP